MVSNEVKKQRGAPKGNLNALKHGFYSRQFRHNEIADLEQHQPHGLDDEIAMMRVLARRTFQLAQGVEDLDQALRLLSTMGAVAARLANLLRSQKFLEGKGDELSATISQALTEVWQEWNKSQ